MFPSSTTPLHLSCLVFPLLTPEPLRAKEGQFFVQVSFLLLLLIKILTLLRSRRGSFPCFFLHLDVFLFVLRFHYFAKVFFFFFSVSLFRNIVENEEGYVEYITEQRRKIKQDREEGNWKH